MPKLRVRFVSCCALCLGLALSVGVMTPAVGEPGASAAGFCVEVTMDAEDLRLSYLNALQARIDRKMTAVGIPHLGVNLKGDAIDMLLSSTDGQAAAKKALEEINVALVGGSGTVFAIESKGDGRFVVRPTAAALREVHDTAITSLASRKKVVSNSKTQGQTIIASTGANSFTVFAPGVKDMAQFERPFKFMPGVDLTVRLWPQAKDGEEVTPAPSIRTHQPARRGFKTRRLVLVPRQSFADGTDIATAKVTTKNDQLGLTVRFTARGAVKLAAVTGAENVGNIIAFMLSNIIMAEHKIEGPATAGEIFVPVDGPRSAVQDLGDKIQSDGFQPLHKIAGSDKCSS